ncbi:MAG: glycosyltransferase [Pyrinomonadaceae bacterium]|nr:glycosyltransferase [Pyrinomonadaceae bacterium]
MRILHISSASAFGGGERHLADLANALAGRGHEIHVALRPASPLREALAALPTENIITLALRNALDLPSAFKLSRIIRQRRIEVVHAHLARDYPLAAFAVRAARAQAQLIVTRHVMFPLGRVHAMTLAGATHVIAVSAPVAHALRAQNLFPSNKIRVIPNGVNVERFASQDSNFDSETFRQGIVKDARFLIGAIGELSHVKGQENFIRAAAFIAHGCADRIDFVIAGEDPSPAGQTRARLAKLADELGLGDRVHFLGKRDDVPALLAALDIFVSASRSEAFGLAIVEAMVAGVPVIATATEGAREIITDNDTGRLVPVGDPEALADATLALIANAAARARLTESARTMASERFSTDRMIEATEQVYCEAVAGQTKS